MSDKRVPLYSRLPEIYRIKDEEQSPTSQLSSYLSLVEEAFGTIHENIESLYHDLFIETCDDWVIPYIGDLLGTSHLSGDPRTLRADVADTIALRRLKGTLGAVELLTYDLTRWGVHCVELRENLIWNQHLNHQRPDEGGKPPYSLPYITRHTVIRGGTITLRDPAMLTLLNTPFDPFAHTADLKPPTFGNARYNLPNLAIFLWRLVAYRVAVSKPVSRGVHPRDTLVDLSKFTDAAPFIARFDVHPVGQPIRLFNTHRFNPDIKPPVVAQIDETPSPIPMARLTENSLAGNPEKYVTIETYNHTDPTLASLDISDAGLQLHLPESNFPGEIWPKPTDTQVWSIRGANLCAWETGLYPPLNNREVAIDPIIGRIAIGVNTSKEGNALIDHLLLTHTYGTVGPVGAHPISRPSSPKEWNGEAVVLREVSFHQNPDGLRDALDNIQNSISPIVIEINDSMTHELDLTSIGGVTDEDGGLNLRLNRSLIIRAADNQRPVIKLAQPLRFRPTNVKGSNTNEQRDFNVVMSNLTVRLEGLYLTRGDSFPAGEPLIARAALHSLEIKNCTLDPGGFRTLDGTRALIHPSMRLKEPYGFFNPDEEEAFNQTPEIILQHSITGPLFIDTGYFLFLSDSIIDAGSGINDDPATAAFAISGAGDAKLEDIDGIGTKRAEKLRNAGITNIWSFSVADKAKLKRILGRVNVRKMKEGSDSLLTWGPQTQVSGITVFGRMRVESIHGKGGIWIHTLEVLNNQIGCIKFSYFSGNNDRLPQNQGCVNGTKARLHFVSEIYGQPAYGQLAHTTDFRIREEGPTRTELHQSTEESLANRDPNYTVTLQDGRVYILGDQMGACGFLLEAHKWRNIQIRYREFMPVGVRPLLIPVT